MTSFFNKKMNLEENGIMVIPNAIGKQEICSATSLDDNIFSGGILPDNAYLRVNSAFDKDQSIKRIYGYEHVQPSIVAKIDAIVRPFVWRYFKSQPNLGDCWLQSNTDNGKTRSWHVDMPQPRFQVKAIVYYSDVLTISTGPFAYMLGSAGNKLISTKLSMMKHQKDFNNFTEYSNREVIDIAHNMLCCTGCAGTAIIFDVSGIHRGLPQRGFTRRALTLSYYSVPGDFRQHQ